ncbi:MAG: hypothetical protein ACK5NG_10235, partial [Chthoniobacterales bacterium]
EKLRIFIERNKSLRKKQSGGSLEIRRLLHHHKPAWPEDIWSRCKYTGHPIRNVYSELDNVGVTHVVLELGGSIKASCNRLQEKNVSGYKF